MLTLKRLFGCLVTAILAILVSSALPGIDPFSVLCLHGSDTYCDYVPFINYLTLGAGLGLLAFSAFSKEHASGSQILGSALIGLFTHWQLLSNWPWYMQINWTLLFIFIVLPVTLVACALFTGATLVRKSLEKGTWWTLTAIWALGMVFAAGRLVDMADTSFVFALFSGYLALLSLNGSVIWTVFSILRWFFKNHEQKA